MRAGLSAAFLLVALPTAGTRPLSAQAVLSMGSPCFDIGPPLLPLMLVRNAVYTVTARSTFEQRLADGNVIHGSSETTRARDSSGRTMEQSARGCERTADGAAAEKTQVSVSDPKARTSLTWILGPRSTHVAFLHHLPEFKRDVPLLRPPRLETLPKAADIRNQQTSEQLGTRTLAGLEATGVRITRIVPTGTEGNDLPIKVVRETWSSQNPRVTLMTVEDDPRVGHRVWEVTTLSLTEPDPSLFTPPQGYTVEEGTPVEPHGAASNFTSSTAASATPPQ